MNSPLALAVLISGNGSNLQAIIDAIEDSRLGAEIRLVLANERDAFGLVRAARHGIATRVIDHRDYPSRAAFDAAMLDCLQPLEPDYIVLAGFMRILGADFVHAFAGRILNVHPSLLPAYKGLDTYRRALDNHETRHGVSIHLVTAELDDGPVLLQGDYPIEPGDDVESLQRKGHRLEHQMYPTLLQWLGEGRMSIDGKQIIHDRKPLSAPIRFEP